MKKDVWIMGISGEGDRFHDNSVCLVKNGKVVFAASEERYSRIKHDPSFPRKAFKAALKYVGIKRSDILLYTSGWPKLALLKTFLNVDKQDLLLAGYNYLKNARPKDIAALIKHLRSLSLKPVADYLPARKHICLDHYLAHAASAYRTAGFDSCLTVVWDGFGTRSDGTLASGGVFECKDGKIRQVETHPLEASIGLFYEAVTNALGFVPAEGEGKTMGLAVYGNPKRFLKKMGDFGPRFEKDKWIKSRYWPDTLPSVDLKYKEIFDATYVGRSLKKMIKKSPEDVAAACQHIIGQEAVKYFKYLYRKYKMKNYAMAGGVFLNVKMGKKLRALSFVKNYYVHSHAGDGGIALGAALEIYANKFSKKKVVFKIESAALGDEFSDEEIKKALDMTKGVRYKKPSNLARYVAERISQGVVVGWFQGRGEWGPRALGSRSVLADPRELKVKDRINKHLKKREWFMPFAPVILEEKMGELLIDPAPCPFMTMAFDITPKGKKGMKAAIHIDNTCRPQTANKKTTPLYWEVISEFEKLTGVPAVLNTSFNKHGLPIVNSPKDAIEHLLWGAVDELAIGSYIANRKKE